MPQVDFYILNVDYASDAGKFPCRLTEKAYRSGLKVFIHTPSELETARLDDLLWTYKEESFLPHSKITDDPVHGLTPPIILACEIDASSASDILINLSQQTPQKPDNFKRIAEIIYDTESDKTAARQRFRYYKDIGCNVKTHDINN